MTKLEEMQKYVEALNEKLQNGQLVLESGVDLHVIWCDDTNRPQVKTVQSVSGIHPRIVLGGLR